MGGNMYQRTILGLFTALSLWTSTTALAADPDSRERLVLTGAERHLVLQEMRNFVQAIQTILAGLAEEDMDQVGQAARQMGSGAANQIPPSVVAKLPDTFKLFAGKVHTTFDLIAMDAEAMGDTQHTLGQIASLTQHCVACHAIYQIERKAETP